MFNYLDLACSDVSILYLLVVLSDEGVWSHHQLGHVAVLVQDMYVVVGRDAVDALPLVFL